MHYLDHNATSPLRPESLSAMTHALAVGGNPSSVHAKGRAARAITEEVREKIARLAGARADQVIFTSGATESNNLALFGAVEGSLAEDQVSKNGSGRITRIFVSGIEHSSVLATADRLAERFPWVKTQRLAVTADGVIDLEGLRVALREGKGHTLVAVMAANNETGVVQPLADVAKLVREAGALLLVDAVPAAGKIKLDFSLCDYMTLSAHKIGGPQGAGALVVRENAPLQPQMMGGGQQKGLRAGTENLSGIAGFGAAAHTLDDGEGERARIQHLRDHFEVALKQAIPEAVIFGVTQQRLCSTSCFAIPGLTAETALIGLDLDGVMMSSGSTCSSGKVAVSHVLAAMGVDENLAGAALRASFGWSSTIEDVNAAIASLVKLHERASKKQSEAA
ncbi:MAG TPA: cysteine desulfurase family protein [Rhizomicrobium sp.]|jgi:cysteine desulfurase|nr:cysteine desulfurase family protein [Rhizomicrobium sp.]